MRMLRWTAVVAGAVVAAGCAAPSRQLTTRIVEDPITLPRRMASGSLTGSAIHYEPTDAQGVGFRPGFRFGITDHLEWVDLLGLRYAFLDDRPADGRRPMPFSLALRAGVFGIGYSSAEGTIVLPIVSLSALKHVANRWALSLAAEWNAQWVSSPADGTPAYNDSLFYTSSRRLSFVSIGATVLRQLTDRVALGIGSSVEQGNACTSPFCDWKSRGVDGSIILGVRPLSWLTVRLVPTVGVRARPDIALPRMDPDATPIVVVPLSVTWVALAGRLDFYW